MTYELAALAWIDRIATIAVVFALIEIWGLRAMLRDDGVWSWSILRDDFAQLPRAPRLTLDGLLGMPRVLWLVLASLAAAVAHLVSPAPWLLAFILGSTALVAIRFRGAVQGSADGMTLLALATCLLGQGFSGHPAVTSGCLHALALVSAASYFVAGVVKVRNSEWRTGEAIAILARSPRYQTPPWFAQSLVSPTRRKAVSWAVIVFELAFPAALVRPELCLVFVPVAFVFHLANLRLFGLHRFVLPWAATYPAVYYVSTLGA